MIKADNYWTSKGTADYKGRGAGYADCLEWLVAEFTAGVNGK